MPMLMARFLCRAGAQTISKFREIFQVSLGNIFRSFSQQWIRTAKAWISAPDAQTSVFLVFLLNTGVLGVFFV